MYPTNTEDLDLHVSLGSSQALLTDREGSRDPWHAVEIDAVLERLDTTDAGLSPDEAVRRVTLHGRNELVETHSNGPWKILWGQLTSVMVLILLAAAALSLVLGKLLEAGAIATIVLLFTVIGFVQEFRAELAIAALRRMAVPLVRVQRNGTAVEVAAIELAPGDVVLLEAGNIVPADLRVIEAAGLRAQESALTGESEPVDKLAHTFVAADAPLGDRSNMLYAGTQISYGRGRGVVVATGMNTELGRIATLLQRVTSTITPLQHRLEQVGKQLAIGGVVVAVVVMILGFIGGESIADMTLTAISVAVAVIPEGLPAVVTFTLAIGAQRMLRRNALIRKLPAVETLGSVTVICSDKTGTLTQIRMTVATVDVAQHRVEQQDLGKPTSAAVTLTLVGGVLCNDADAQLDEHQQLVTLGDPTETAILSAAHDAGIDVVALRNTMTRVAELPFDSERKRMSTVHTWSGQAVPDDLAMLCPSGSTSFVKGAVERVVERTVSVWDDDQSVPFTDSWRTRVLDATDQMASDGMRVLAVAFRSDLDRNCDHPEEDLTLLGLVAIVDPPRPEVGEAVSTCSDAGIRTVMITGDHPSTAVAIATKLGIGSHPAAITGVELDQLDAQGLARAVNEYSVFARVSPEHKLRIVEALQRQGDVVAMTGDGVNDAPALKKADIGVAMGITGTDVSKEASDMVLRDDNFATIVAAVEEGRVIYDNLRRFVKFAVAGNIGKIVVMVIWPLLFLLTGDAGSAVALLPLQLLWLNLMTDGLLGLALGFEPAERTLMRRPPHRPGDSIWAGGLGVQASWIGAVIGVAALAVGYLYYANGRTEWQTMVFTTLAFVQVFQAIGTRSNSESLRTIGWWSNPVMSLMCAIVVALQLIALYTPLNTWLNLEPLSAWDLGLCAILGIGLLVVLETTKMYRRGSRKHLSGAEQREI